MSSFIKICLINAQSLAMLSHLLTVKSYLSECIVDVLAVTETWLKDCDSDDYCKIPGYSCLRFDRTGKRGGGVCMYIRNNIKSSLLYSSPSIFSNKPEFILADLFVNSVHILFAIVYRRPQGEGFSVFLNILSQYAAKFEHCIVCGDFNMNFKVLTGSVKDLSDNLADINLFHLPIWDTHHNAISDTTIDLFFVPRNVNIQFYGKLSTSDLSMHDLLYILYPISVPHHTCSVRKIRNYRKVDTQAISNDANNIPWHELNIMASIECKIMSFMSILLSLWNRYAPENSVNISKPRSPWINADIIHFIKLRNSARRRWHRIRSLEA
jgi:hypothetical protein